MIISKKHIEWLAIIFFLVVVSVIFQQIYTSLTEQGIASGGPYDNAAAYPRAVAILIGMLVVVQFAITFLTGERPRDQQTTGITSLARPCGLLVIFAAYLGVLGYLGYHLTTTPMIIAVMLLCGMRRLPMIAVSAILISFVLAFLFEKFLNVVLPGGTFGLNIPW